MRTIEINKLTIFEKNLGALKKQFAVLKHLNSSELKYMSPWAQYDEKQNTAENLASNKNYENPLTEHLKRKQIIYRELSISNKKQH